MYNPNLTEFDPSYADFDPSYAQNWITIQIVKNQLENEFGSEYSPQLLTELWNTDN